jgi:hypothetical protein
MWGMLATRAACSAALACAFGCAALPWPSGPDRPDEQVPAGAYYDLRGAVHVHTRASHDSHGAIGDLVDAAHDAGLAFVALTEHPLHASFRPARGVVEGVILIPGWEINAAGASILAVGIEHLRGLPREPRALVAAIHARGGAAFVGHFERSQLADPALYAPVDPDGVEIANLHAAALDAPLSVVFGSLFLPAYLALRPLLRPPTANLERLARLPGVRGLVGGVDAHAKFRLLGPLGGTFDRYRDIFRLVTTHVLARDRSQKSILEALRSGRSYVAFEGLGLVEQFVAVRMADGVHVQSPGDADLRLVCAGVTVAGTEGREALLVPPPDAERCHVEAWLGSDLWVITSPLEPPVQ